MCWPSGFKNKKPEEKWNETLSLSFIKAFLTYKKGSRITKHSNKKRLFKYHSWRFLKVFYLRVREI